MMKIWNNLTAGSMNRKIFGAAVTVGMGTVLVKVVAVMKELVVASRFGTTDSLDAFLIALMVPAFIVNVIASSFKAALMPTYMQVQEQEGRKAAQQLFSGVTFWSLSILAIAIIFMLVTAPLYLPFFAAGFSAKKLDLTFKLLCALAPFVLLSGIIILWSAVLNAKERFVLAAISPIVTPGITIILLLEIASWESFSLVIGLIGGAILEIVILGVALKKQGIALLPKWFGFEPHLRQVVNQYVPTVAGALLMCSANIVDQSMAAMLTPGSVAALSYADRVVALPLFLTTTALNTAVTPYFSKMAACKDWIGLRHTLKSYLWLIFVFTVPLTGVIIACSELIVRLLFERGSFTADDTQLVAQILNSYALQIPFYISAVFLVNIIISIQKNYILVWGSGLNLIINILGNYIFMQFLGIKGIALSTSCVYIVSFSFLLFFTLKFLKNLRY